MIIKATYSRLRWSLESEEGDPLGFTSREDDIKRTALCMSDPGDTLEIHRRDGSIEEIDL